MIDLRCLILPLEFSPLNPQIHCQYLVGFAEDFHVGGLHEYPRRGWALSGRPGVG